MIRIRFFGPQELIQRRFSGARYGSAAYLLSTNGGHVHSMTVGLEWHHFHQSDPTDWHHCRNCISSTIGFLLCIRRGSWVSFHAVFLNCPTCCMFAAAMIPCNFSRKDASFSGSLVTFAHTFLDFVLFLSWSLRSLFTTFLFALRLGAILFRRPCGTCHPLAYVLFLCQLSNAIFCVATMV